MFDNNGQPTDGGINDGSIPQPPANAEGQVADDAVPSANSMQLSDWQNKLAKRGILEQALLAGWNEFKYNGRPGWAIPLYDDHQQPWKLPNGKPAQRWKYSGNDPHADKYAWGNGQRGKSKPEGCDWYHVPYVAFRSAVKESNGELIIACGEPDMLTFLSIGILNVTTFFGEKNIPENVLDKLQEWEVTTVHYYPDQDKTGSEAAGKLVTMLHGSGIKLLIYELPEEVNNRPVKDINDLYCAVDCNRQQFLHRLSEIECSELTNRRISETSNGNAAGKIDQLLPEKFLHALEEALHITSYKSNGWSAPMPCVFQTHENDGKRPSAAYHRDMHLYRCFKCGQSWLAIEVGEKLNLYPGDFRNRRENHSKNKSTPSMDPSQNEKASEEKPKPPTDDELGDMLIQAWNGDYAYFQESWHRYEAGFWLPENRMERWTWDIMKDLKYRGVKPNKSRARSVEDYLRSHLRVEDDRVDCGDCYINLQDGLYNLDTATLEPHQRELYQTSQMGFHFRPTAQCPTWLQSLNQWLVDENGQPDLSLIALLQEAFGYSLTTDTSFEVAFWLCGPAGSGKSTALKVLSALAGNAQVSLDLSMLEKNTYQLADIVGKRVVTCTEARAGSALVDNVLKQLISGEEMVVRQVYGKTIRFIPKAKIWWAMNERPANHDSSNAVYRRLKLIQFPKAISGNHQDRKLFEKLKAELPGIFNWSMEGLQRLRQKGNFTPSARADQELEAYKRENDVEAAFISDTEWCLRDPQGQTTANDLYLALKLWCERYGHFPIKSNIKVARDWERLGFKKTKNGSMHYLGISLTPYAAREVKFKK